MNKNKIIILSMLLMGLALFINMDEAAADSSVIYVNATGGNDNWDGQSQFWVNGTTSGPKKTISSGTTAVVANGTVNIADGTYSGTGNGGITLTKNMTIQGQSQNNTIIDGSGSRQIFVISSGVNVTMLNLTIQNARTTSTNGGAVQNNGGTLTVNNCKFSGNSAGSTFLSGRDVYGGAIYNTGNLNIINSVFLNNYVDRGFWASGSTYGGAIYSNGQLTISNTIFESNYALNRGGAIYNDGRLSVVGSSFNNNYVSDSGHDYNGGAIFNSNSGILTLTGSTFNNNHASVGGALLTFNNSNITGCTFTGNNANNEYGGGAVAWGNTGTPATGTMNVIDSVFTNNRAGYGGAIWSYGTINVSGSTFTLNQATYNGGAIRTWGTLNIIGSDLSGNQAGNRGNAISNYQGTTTANFNRIIGSGSMIECITGSINALNNWWGSQTSPASKVNGNVTASTWLVLNINAVPNPTHTGYTSTITADLTRNQNGVYFNPVNGHVPNGILALFNATLGSIPSTSTLVSGSTSRIFTAGNTPGVATVSATVDGVQVNTSINLNPVAALQINQNVNTPVNVGDRVTFVVSVVNNGPNTATNIQIRDIIPVELTNVVVTPSVGNYNNVTGIWTINTLNNGATATLTISGDATIPMAGKTINNTATQLSQNEFTPALAESTVGVYTKMADVQLSQSANSPVNVGDVVNYVVTVTNTGPDNATNFIIENKIPAGLLNVVVTPSTGSYLNGNWTVPFLANGDFATLTITAIASANMAGKNTTNTATKIFETEYDPTTIGESTSASTYTKSVDIAVSHNSWYPNLYSYNYGSSPVFTVRATNNGPDEASGVILEYNIGSGFEYITCNPYQGSASYDPSTNTIMWDIGDMPVGGRTYLYVYLRVIETGNNTVALTNSAVLKHVDQADQNSGNNRVNRSIYVAPAADVQINQTLEQTGSNQVTITVTATNNGPNDANSISVINSLVSSLSNISVLTPEGTSYNNGIWLISSLINGESKVLTIIGTFNSSGIIKNTATKTAQDVIDWNLNNNAQTCTIGIINKSVDIAVSHNSWYPNLYSYNYGSSPVFTVRATNNGPDEASGVILEYNIGSGFEYITCNPYQGSASYDPSTNTIMWDIGDMPVGGRTYLYVYLRVIETGNNTVALTNSAVLKHVDQADQNSGNNRVNRSIYVAPAADVQINQTLEQTGSNQVTITVIATNNAPDDANNINISTSIPTELTNMSIVASPGTSFSNGVWTIPVLGYGATSTLIIQGDIIKLTGTIKNTVLKTSQNEIDWNLNNNGKTIFI